MYGDEHVHLGGTSGQSDANLSVKEKRVDGKTQRERERERERKDDKNGKPTYLTAPPVVVAARIGALVMVGGQRVRSGRRARRRCLSAGRRRRSKKMAMTKKTERGTEPTRGRERSTARSFDFWRDNNGRILLSEIVLVGKKNRQNWPPSRRPGGCRAEDSSRPTARDGHSARLIDRSLASGPEEREAGGDAGRRRETSLLQE